MANPDYKKAIALGKQVRFSKFVDLLNCKTTLTIPEVKLMRELELEFKEALPDDDTPSIIIPSLRKAVEYLHDKGYQATKSSLFNHKKAGLLRFNTARSFDSLELDRYAAANLTRIKNNETSEDNQAQQRLEELQQQKLETTTKIAQEQLRILERRNADIENEITGSIGRELAKRERFFKLYLINYMTSEAPAFIEIVHGDQQYTPEFISRFRRGLDSALGNLIQFKGVEIQCTPSGEVMLA